MVRQFQSGAKAQILIVDNLPDNVQLLTLFLEPQQYEIRGVHSGQLALQEAYQNPPHLILLKMHLPEESGQEIRRQLKANAATAHIPVIFICTASRMDDRNLAFEWGGQDYITQPFFEREVLTRVRNQLLIQQHQLRLTLSLPQQRESQSRRTAKARAPQLDADLGQQMQTMQVLEQLNQQKENLLHALSHELRTPITSMKMVIELLNVLTDKGRNLTQELATSSHISGKILQYLKVLQMECDRELALIEDLLSLQQIEAGTFHRQPIPIRLQELLPPLLEPFLLHTEVQQQTLEVDLPSSCPEITLDVFSFTRVLTELLNNACKYTPANETISVSAQIIQGSSDPRHILELTVSNTGVEMTPEDRARIFDRFYRIPQNDPRRPGGTGLGLTLVKQMVERMNGTVSVESRDNQIRFVVRIPADSGSSQAIAQRAADLLRRDRLGD